MLEKAVRIALVDRHPLLRRGLIGELEQGFTMLDVVESDDLSSSPDLELCSAVEIVSIGLDQLWAKTGRADFYSKKFVSWGTCHNSGLCC